MEFPTCPSCSQSVIDDDADICPFCGAAMDGSSPAPTKAPAKTPAAAEPKREDDPFAVERKATPKAIPLAKRPVKTRTLPVVCPMCDTTGYAPPQASKADVRCANKECMVPVFTAPELKTGDEPEPEPEQGPFSVLFWSLVGISVAVGVGFLVWAFVLSGPDISNQATDYVPTEEELAILNGETPSEDKPKTNTETNPKPTTVDDGPDTAEVIKTSLVAMQNQLRSTRGRDLFPVARLMLDSALLADAESFADEPSRVLDKVTSGSEYYRITPAVTRAWAQLQTGDLAGAGKTADTAVSDAKSLRSNIPSYSSAIQLATLLSALNRTDDARQILNQYASGAGVELRLAAELETARANGDYNLVSVAANRSTLPSPTPAWDATVVSLVSRGYGSQAAKLAMSAADDDSRTAALSAFGEASARLKDGSDVAASLESNVAKLPVTLQPIPLARAGTAYVLSGQKPLGMQLAKKATALLEKQTAPKPVTLPEGYPEILEMTAGDVNEKSHLARSAAEVARLNSLLGETDSAVKNLQRALAQTRSAAPRLSVMQSRWKNYEENRFLVEGDLTREFELPNQDAIRRKLSEYRTTIQRLQRAAEQMADVEVAILSDAASWSIAEQAWAAAKETDVTSRVAEDFAIAFASNDKSELSAEADGLKTASGNDFKRIRGEAVELIAESKFREAQALIEARKPLTTDEKVAMSAHLVSGLVTDNRLEDAMQFAGGFEDPDIRKLTTSWLATQAVLANQHDELKSIAAAQSISQDLRVAYEYGRVRGLVLKLKAAPPAEESDASGAN